MSLPESELEEEEEKELENTEPIAEKEYTKIALYVPIKKDKEIKKKKYTFNPIFFFNAKIMNINEFGLMKIKFEGIIDLKKLPVLNESNIDISLKINNEYQLEDEFNKQL